MSYDILFNKALQLHEAGQFEEAEQIYRQILETAPEQPDVLNLLGLVAQAKGVQQEACDLFARAIKANPDNPAFYYNLAFSLRLDGKPHEALQYFSKVISLRPEMPEVYNETAQLRFRLGQVDAARQDWARALSLNPEFAEAAANLADSYSSENPPKAIAELENVVRKYPEGALGFYYLSRLYLAQHSYSQAWIAASRAKELAPASDEVRVILGQLSLVDGKTDNAKVYFEKALLLNSRNIAALSGAAALDAQTENFEAAEQKYKKIIDLDEHNFEAHNNYAEMLYRQGRTAEALEEYRQAVIANPKSAEVSNNLAAILKDIGDYEQAMGLLMNALALKPDLEEASVNMAETLVLYAAKNREEALKIAQNWRRLMPDNVFAVHTADAFEGGNSEVNQIYAERLFDHFADHYELVVKTLGYAVPLAVGRIAGNDQVSVVDLGCGTGLAGKAVKGPGRYLVGVDVSQKMLDEAAKKDVYDKLVKEDALTFLQHNEAFGMVIAADVFGYVGDIRPIVRAAKDAILIFSIETTDKNDFEMAPNGRYRHHPDYIRRVLEEEGYRIEKQEALVLRSEGGKPVDGLIYRAEKSSL